MARNRNNSQIFDALSSVGIMRLKASTPGDTTVQTAFAAGVTSFDVAAIANFASGDLIRVGSGSEQEVAKINGAPAGNTITVTHAMAFAHDAAEDVEEIEETDLGPTTDDGVETDAEGTFEGIFAGTRRQVMAYRGAQYAPVIRFSLLETCLENLAVAHGMTEAQVTGSGTSATPHRLVLDPAKFGLDINAVFYFKGLMHDTLTNVLVRAWGCEVDWTKAFRGAYRRTGGETAYPVEVRVTSAIEVQTWK